MRAYIAAGSIAAATHELEIAESTARQHLSGLYRPTGCMNAAQALTCWDPAVPSAVEPPTPKTSEADRGAPAGRALHDQQH